MYAAGYHHPHRPHTMDPRSHGYDDLYRQVPPDWQMPAHAPYPDLSIPPQHGYPAHIASPISTNSNGRDNSPVDYFSLQNGAPAQQEPWTIHPAHQVPSIPGPYVDGGYAPQIKVEANSIPNLNALYSQDHGYMQDPSQFNPTQFTQQSGMNGGGASGPGPERNKRGGRQAAAAKRTGACARCRRLKMKCTFANTDDDICSRCTGGGYECVFPGRKPRAPGMRMVLRQQIREKDAMIDNLLNQVNPGPTMATPLTLVPSRLPLSQEERTEYRDILTYLERAAQQGGQRVLGDARVKFDISALEDIVSDDDSDGDEDMQDGTTSPKRGGSPKTEHVPVDTIVEVTAPTGIMATAALQSAFAAQKAESSNDSTTSHGSGDAGVAGEQYFLPGPQANLQLRRLIIERQAAPDILLSGLVTPEDVTALFEIHYKYVNAIIPILDENIHSPASVLARCPFLFTVICTVASRYYKEKPHIHGMAIHFAKAAAANAVIDGWKTVEMCQAFALWSVYNPPARRWEEDRAWCYTGIAFRLATELNLSRIPDKFADERQERESHNRTRMWLMCFIMDRCLSIQSGKAWMVQEDAMLRDAESWLRKYKYHNQCDGYLVSLTELLLIMSRFVGTVNPAFGASSVESLNDIDFAALYKAYDDELMAWKAKIDVRHEGEKTSKDPALVMEITLINCVFQYCRLVICCCGMQLMSKHKAMKPNELFAGCVQAATSLVKLMVEDFVPSGFVPYFPELVYVHSAFAAVVLLKCLRPEFNVFLDIQQEERIIELVKRLFDTWTSDKFSLDERHNTQLYARFLKQLLQPHLVRLAKRKQSASAQTGSEMGGGGSEEPLPPVSPTSTTLSGSASSSPVFPAQDPMLRLGDIYATDVDVSKAAAELAAAGMIPSQDVSWDQLFGSTDSGGFLNGPMGGGDLTGMMGDECLAAMMGLGNETWFLTSGPP